ncbi:transcriptional regulator [Planctomicrobium sp. SH668]|uniref:transcriptional regulator n=1 Tax=Planctomicrobium sp. SH668 TaxID=3448126 RepID=UPI003F5BBFEF
MQNALRIPDSSSDELPRELVELGKRIAALPEEQYQSLEQPYAQVVDCVRRRRRILNLVQEALSQLRLDVKYLMFDLEVTRAERDELRAQLGESEPGDTETTW